MAVEIKAFGEIKNGAFYPRNSKRYMNQLRNAGNVNQVLLTMKGANIRTLDQNAYAWVVCTAIADRMQDDGWNITPDDIYHKIEDTYCKEQKVNEKTGKTMTGITKLKKQPTDKFHDIIEQVRQGHMNQYPDNYIELPHEHYGITIEAYDLWRMGKITFAKAKNMSNKY